MARKMKDSGIEWIGEIPEGWEVHRMKSCISQRDGGAWGDEATGETGDCSCLRIADFDYEHFRFTDSNNLTIRHYASPIIKKLLLQKNDILIEKSGGGEKTPVGRTVLFDKEYPALFANFMDRLRCSDFILPQYLQYVFVTFYKNRYTQNYIKQTTGIQNLDLSSMLADEFVPVPNLNEQKLIVCYLESKCSIIDNLLSKTRSSIEEYKKLKQALITQAVTTLNCPNVKLKYLMDIIVDCPHETPIYTFTGNYLVIRTSDQSLASLRCDEYMYRLDEAEYKKRTRRLTLDKDDIVYGREGSWGLACLVPQSNKYCLGQRVMQFRCNTRLLYPKYAMYALNSETVYMQGALDTIGSTAPHVNISTICNYLLPVPALTEQKEITNYLDAKCAEIDGLIAKKEQLVKELESYKKSLIYEVVTGKREV